VYYGWQRPNSSTTDGFSAACWFFGQELTDMALTANRTAPIIGLIQTAWGGTEIDDWIVNKSIAECKNASGAPEPNRYADFGVGFVHSSCICRHHAGLHAPCDMLYLLVPMLIGC